MRAGTIAGFTHLNLLLLGILGVRKLFCYVMALDKWSIHTLCGLWTQEIAVKLL